MTRDEAQTERTPKMTWNPIETAPKDGRQILVPIGHGLQQVVSWWDDAWRETTNGLRLRNEPSIWMALAEIPDTANSPALALTTGGQNGN